MKCFYCGNEHDGIKCPMVAAYDFGPDGKITRVEFVTFADIQNVNSLFDLMPEGTTKQ